MVGGGGEFGWWEEEGEFEWWEEIGGGSLGGEEIGWVRWEEEEEEEGFVGLVRKLDGFGEKKRALWVCEEIGWVRWSRRRLGFVSLVREFLGVGEEEEENISKKYKKLFKKIIFVNSNHPRPCPSQMGGVAQGQLLFKVNGKGNSSALPLPS